MRALSVRQATRCETAHTKTCTCRCGGLLHGAKRAENPEREFFEDLTRDDPHHVPSATEKRMRAKARRAAAKRRGQAVLPFMEETP